MILLLKEISHNFSFSFSLSLSLSSFDDKKIFNIDSLITGRTDEEKKARKKQILFFSLFTLLICLNMYRKKFFSIDYEKDQNI